MNNYCTNCGKPLSKHDMFCTNCGTPIVDIPYDYVPPIEKEKKKKRLKIIGIILLSIVAIILIIIIIKIITIKSLQKKYVEPFLGEGNYEISYSSSGQCVIAGECSPNIFRGCDGGCKLYEYLPEDECKSYYYNVDTENERFTVTVFKKDGKYSAVRGKNIYGEDYKKEPEEDYDLYYRFNSNSDDNKIEMNDGMFLYFNTEIINNETHRDAVISGYVYNPTNSNEIIPLIIEYYDENNNLIGTCSKEVQLLGENHLEIPYTCSLIEEELYYNKTLDDIKSFNINVNK